VLQHVLRLGESAAARRKEDAVTKSQLSHVGKGKRKLVKKMMSKKPQQDLDLQSAMIAVFKVLPHPSPCFPAHWTASTRPHPACCGLLCLFCAGTHVNFSGLGPTCLGALH
jgi:hypothetical protein